MLLNCAMWFIAISGLIDCSLASFISLQQTADFEDLVRTIVTLLDPEEQDRLREMEDWIIKNEGTWVLSESFNVFLGKLKQYFRYISFVVNYFHYYFRSRVEWQKPSVRGPRCHVTTSCFRSRHRRHCPHPPLGQKGTYRYELLPGLRPPADQRTGSVRIVCKDSTFPIQ